MLTAFGPVGRWKLGSTAGGVVVVDNSFLARGHGRFAAIEVQTRRRRVGSRLHGWILFLIGALYAVLAR